MKRIFFVALTILAITAAGCSTSESTRTPQVGTTVRDTINGVPCVVYKPADLVESRKTANAQSRKPLDLVESRKTAALKVESEGRYPVLYLQHGMWGNEDDWVEKGNLLGIMDSLLRAGAVREMVVIMPDNCPSKPTWEEEKDNATNGEWEANFAQFMAEAESRYPISNEPKNRAIAGLSMGGYHTMRVSSVLDGQFEYVAMFSPATFVHNAPTRPKVFWLAIGTEDFLWDSFQDYRKWLESEHVEYTYYESTGGHDWPNWQDYLERFLPKIFLN